MRWGIYARNGFEGAAALAEGAFAIGDRAEVRSVADYGSGQTEAFDVVAVFGLQGRGPLVREDYATRGVPVLVVDYGYLRRTNHAHDWRTGHWQTSLARLNRPPPEHVVDASRFEALGLKVAERGGDPHGYTLLCPQTTGDASHGLDQSGLQRWVNAQLDAEPRALLRPHPLQEHLTYGARVCPAPTLEAALAGARMVVTLNSNIGNDCMLSGVPALATLPGASWEGLSGRTLPSVEARTRHFHRLAWGQWTWAEFRTGLPHRFLRTNVLC